MNSDSLEPEIIELEDGSIGYFYSLCQLEAIHMKRMYNKPYEELRGLDRGNPLNQ